MAICHVVPYIDSRCYILRNNIRVPIVVDRCCFVPIHKCILRKALRRSRCHRQISPLECHLWLFDILRCQWWSLKGLITLQRLFLVLFSDDCLFKGHLFSKKLLFIEILLRCSTLVYSNQEH